MKNFKKVLAVVLAVLFVVPSMAFGISADDGELSNWTVAIANNSSNVNADMENDVAVVTANPDGSISATDASVALGVPVNDTALTKITSAAPNYLDGMEFTIEPVGTDMNGDGVTDYASHYALCLTDHPALYDGKQQDTNDGDGYSLGHYVYPDGQDKENTFFAVLNDEIPIVGAPANGEAEYVTYAVISNGNFWTIKFVKFDEPVKFSEEINIEVINALDEEVGAWDFALMINDQYAPVPECSDAYETEVGKSPVFYASVAAYAHGQNQKTASFNLTSICNSADVAGYTGVYCAEDAHVWSDWSEPTVADCTNDSITTRACANCPKVETEVVAAATGHAYEETIVPATCDAAGSKTNVCATCGDTVVEEIAALGHDYSVMHWITLPTADAAGTARVCCAVCGKLQAELASIEADLSTYWTYASANNASDAGTVVVNEDGSISVLDASVVTGTAVNDTVISKITSNFATVIDGAEATIDPVGADVNGDGVDDYASNYAFCFTTNPYLYNDNRYETNEGDGYCVGHYVYPAGQDNEFTFIVVFDDDIPLVGCPENGEIEKVTFVVLSSGNYWACKFVDLETPIKLSEDNIKVEVFSAFDPDINEYATAVIVNDNEFLYVPDCSDPYEKVEGQPVFYTSVAAYANGVNQKTASFNLISINNSSDVANYAGDGLAEIVPTIAVEGDDLVVDNGALVKDVIIISGEGYNSYAEIKAAKDTADVYYRATYAKFEGASHKFTLDLASFAKYTVLVRTVDGKEYIQTIETGNTDPSACEPQLNDSGRVKFVFEKEVKVLRYAPVAGLRTVAALKAADGYKAIKASNFAAIDADWTENYSEFRLFPGAGTYSYVVEYTDGVKEFGEFTINSNLWTGEGNTPVFTANGITNMAQSKFIRARYAPGYWESEAEVKAAAGSKVILKSYTVRDIDEAGANLPTRHYNFKTPLSGEYTFAIVWGNAAAPATIYHVTF